MGEIFQDKTSAINALEKVQDLINQRDEADLFAIDGWKQETISRLIEMREQVGRFPERPSAFSSLPEFIEREDSELGQLAQKKDKRKMATIGIAIVADILLFLTGGLLVLIAFGLIIGAVLFLWYSDAESKYKKYKAEREEAQKNSDESFQHFRKALETYIQECCDGVKKATEYCKRYCKAYNEVIQFMGGEMEQRRNDAEERVEQLNREIAANDFIDEKYLHLVPDILSNLKTGRADSYKEAINLAIQEEREAEVEKARRMEEARRTDALAAQEAQRTAILAEQAAEQRRHNQQMETMEIDRARMEGRAKTQEKHICVWCANYGHCSRNRFDSSKITNCGGFVPRDR